MLFLQLPANKDEWKIVFHDFNKLWQVPNCGGALDGKHIRILPPANSGAKYYNYKGFYSVILMAVVNARKEFIYIDVGKNGRCSDGGVIELTAFYEKLIKNKLHLPEPSENIGKLNSIFLADEAFALHKNLLKPFPQKELTYEKKIYNYRLSRGRNVCENAFGLIASRFRILHTAINLRPDKINYVVAAICVLHNYLQRKSIDYSLTNTNLQESTSLIVPNFDDTEINLDNSYLTSLCPNNRRNTCSEAKENRFKYLEYFNGVCKLSWQDEMIRKGKA